MCQVLHAVQIGLTALMIPLTLQVMVHALAKEGIKGMEDLANSDRLRRCIEPSLNSLPSERAALACLTMFPASFDSTAAAAVLGTDLPTANWKLRLLQNRSLVSAEARPDSHPSSQQYSLHLFIRDLAAEGLQAQPDYISAQQRFVQHFLLIWRSAQQDTAESQQRLHQQRQSVAKAVEMLAAMQQPLSISEDCCNLGIIALDSIDVVRLETPTVAAALKTLLCWAQASGSAEAVLAAREQLAYVQSRDAATCQEANAELLSVLHTRLGTSGPNSYSLVMCLEGLANAAVLMGCSGQTTGHEADHACDEWRKQLVSMLEATKGRESPAYLRAAAWVAYGLSDNDDSVKELRALWADAVWALGANHPATLAIQSQFAVNLSTATRQEMLNSAEPLRESKGSLPYSDDGLPDSIISAWLEQHWQQCQDQLGLFDNDTVYAQLSFGTILTRCSGAAERSRGLELIAKGMHQAEVCWGKCDEYTLNAQLDVHASALQRLWKLQEALIVVDNIMQLSKEEFGPNSTYIVTCLQSKAKLLQLMGNYSECESTLECARQQVQAAQTPRSDSIELTLAKTGVYLDMAENFSLQGR